MSRTNAWRLMKLLKQSILDNNGLVFGGFVRDFIIHDHFSARYYKKNADLDVSEQEAKERYNDINYLPETIGRLVIPYDIDCVMTETDFNVFVNGLQHHRLRCTSVFARKSSAYINGFERLLDDTLKHRRILISLDIHYVLKELDNLPIYFDRQPIENELYNVLPMPIIIDVITSKNAHNEPFMTDLDFECNGLYMSKYGLSIASSLVKNSNEYSKFVKMNDVIKDIVNKEAVYMHPYVVQSNIANRVNKFIERGWKIRDCLNCISSITDISYDGHCIICHDNLPEIHFKLTCCDARYHTQCLKMTLDMHSQSRECIMCKAQLPLQTTHGNLF